MTVPGFGPDVRSMFALAVVIVPVLVATAVVLLVGPEAKGVVFGRAREPEPTGGGVP